MSNKLCYQKLPLLGVCVRFIMNFMYNPTKVVSNFIILYNLKLHWKLSVIFFSGTYECWYCTSCISPWCWRINLIFWWFQAFEMQGRHAERRKELSKICLIHNIFPPKESSVSALALVLPKIIHGLLTFSILFPVGFLYDICIKVLFVVCSFSSKMLLVGYLASSIFHFLLLLLMGMVTNLWHTNLAVSVVDKMV